MSARKPSSIGQTSGASSMRTAAAPHGKSSVTGAIVPRKRARDGSLSEEEEKSSSEESTKMVGALRDEDTALRVPSGKKTPTGFSDKRQKISS